MLIFTKVYIYIDTLKPKLYSKWTAEQVLKTYPISFDEPVVIPSGIDVKEINVTNKRNEILFCGRLSKSKR
ncbi:hypothetical protein CDQ84_17720 [Clostridium thermosuccinogenes]|uniref:Uncharacterized protein n=1 Tax=Clostridium thermosuccinogenes TaxID=84032 RepID=A0A2K2F8G3_9CLOT|nr:hypothetical protein CDO33_12915 [Pseudoclostridium thermosuccinogenes]PNT94602.1 hypothetical protein CDQ85_17635 [Pseudoclostridium thermosuccinogenes]PNT95070.1 hypothetical protein CDQ84_17720 [Pseudoclostridium thermosuccinogenes]